VHSAISEGSVGRLQFCPSAATHTNINDFIIIIIIIIIIRSLAGLNAINSLVL